MSMNARKNVAYGWAISGQQGRGEEKKKSRRKKKAPIVSNPNCSTIFVGNLSPDTDKKTIEELFEPFGAVESVRRGRHKRYAFVEMLKANAVEAISKLNGTTLEDMELTVELSNSPAEGGKKSSAETETYAETE